MSGDANVGVRNSALCYVVMPFAQDLRSTYDSAIKPAVSAAAATLGADVRCLRGDEIICPGSITREIIASIHGATVVVADLTGSNPNVFYELGIAHSLGNKTIMITQTIKSVPFDVSAYRLICYDSSPDGLIALRDQLAGALVEVLTGTGGSSNPVQDFAPIRFPDVVITLERLIEIESVVKSDVWLLEPTLDVDLKLFRDVISHNIQRRSINYRYLVPNTKSALRSIRRMRDVLALDEQAWLRVAVRLVDPHIIESEVVIYDAFTEREQVFLMSPLEDAHPFWFRVRGSRATAIRERYEAVWEDASLTTDVA